MGISLGTVALLVAAPILGWWVGRYVIFAPSWRRLALLLLATGLPAAGWLVGSALQFTPLQGAAICLSCFCLASWLAGQLDIDHRLPTANPVVGVLVTVLFAAALRSAFWTDGPPRFISVTITTLPAIPFAVASVVGVVWGR